MRFLASALAAVLAGCSAQSASLHGTVITPARPARAFSLTDQDGRAFSLSSAHGSAVALYFGFTHCKDVCPQTLALLGEARTQSKLTPEQLRIVMVTVDPKRDTDAAFQTFFIRTGVQATGLTGAPAQLRAVYQAYGIAVEPQKHDIAHTDDIFLIGPDGTLRELLDPHTPVDAVAQDLRAVVE